MAEAKKITKTLLDSFKKHLGNQRNAERELLSLTIGVRRLSAELESAYDDYAKAKEGLESTKKKINDKYGDNINVDLSTGEILEQE